MLLGSSVLRMLSAALTFLNGVVLARLLGPDVYGTFVVIFSWLSLGYFGATAGLPSLVLREISNYGAQSQPRYGKGVLLFSVGLFLALMVLVVLVFEIFGAQTQLDPLGLWPYVIIFFWGLSILLENATRGLGHIVIGQVAELLLRPGMALGIFAVIAVLKTNRTLTEKDALWALTAGTIATAAFSGLVVWRVAQTHWTEAPAYKAKLWFEGALKNSLTNIILAVLLQVSFLMIGLFLGNEELGQYRAIYQLATAAGIGLLAAKAVVGPQIARSLEMQSADEFKAIMRRAVVTGLVFSGPCCLAILVAPETLIVLLFGEAYAQNGLSLRILGVAVFLNTVFGPVDVALQIVRWDKAMILAAALRMVLHLALLALAVTHLGLVGAALAHTVALVTWCAVMRVVLKKATAHLT